MPNVSGLVFRSTTIPTLVLDYKNFVVLENKAASDFFGGSIVGCNIVDITTKGESTLDRSFFDKSFSSEIVVIESPAGVRQCDMRLSVETDKYNDALCKVVIFRDITEHQYMIQDIRDTSEQLESALVQANSANRAKTDFLSNMSHEMRTPMNAIIGMTAIGKKTNDIDAKNHALSKIGDASSHLLGVINDVLDMAKIEANKLDIVDVEFSFDRMLQKVITVVNFRVEEKNQVLSFDVDKDIPSFVIGDDQRLAQVITNLMANAVKFTPNGGKIHFEAALIGEADGVCELRLGVTDSGIGISSEQIEKLFVAFEQVETGTSREYGGTGLGLVISKRIVELMGGDIWVESEYGTGSRFVFTVKVKRGKKNLGSLLAPGVNWENVRVLAVDDMSETRKQFHAIFNNLAMTCDVATDGIDARRMIEQHGPYDIYFIDWRMPGMDGVELTKWIKTHDGDRQFVIVMITAADWGNIREEATSAGVDRHLLKPLFSSMVIDCMNEILGISAADLSIRAQTDEFKGKKMLVAEDIEINREILVALLESSGLTIDCADNGKEALEMLVAAPNEYDIVFMDVQMPHMDGFETTRRSRALPMQYYTELPIVAMTANVFKDDIEACLEAGMNDHLGKPLDINVVLSKLRKYL